MSDNSFVKWGSCKSTDKNNPDTLEFKVIGKDTVDTEYSICVRVMRKEGERWTETMLPLKAHDSTNGSLMRQWQNAADSDLLKLGKHAKILTWKSTSKNGNPIRRYKLVII